MEKRWSLNIWCWNCIEGVSINSWFLIYLGQIDLDDRDRDRGDRDSCVCVCACVRMCVTVYTLHIYSSCDPHKSSRNMTPQKKWACLGPRSGFLNYKHVNGRKRVPLYSKMPMDREKIIELENYNLATITVIIDLGKNHQTTG